MKYGKEGLDDKKLSAILVSEPISDGTPSSRSWADPGTRNNSVLIFLEDNIGPLIGQCRKLRHHLRDCLSTKAALSSTNSSATPQPNDDKEAHGTHRHART